MNNANVNARTGYQSNISQTPFFNDPGVRRQLNLNDNQFNTLNRAYQGAYSRYNQGLSNLNNPNLTEQQREQQLLQLESQFNQNFSGSLNSTLNNPQALSRYNQLNRQFQGVNAFNDPSVRKELNLTQDQIRQLRTLQMNWRRQMQQFRANGANRNAVDPAQWTQMQQQLATQLNGVLTPEQQQMWARQTGQPYSFPPTAFTGFGDDVQRNGNQPLTPAQTGVVPNGPASQDQTTNGPTTIPTGSGGVTTQGTTVPAGTAPASTAQGTQGGTVR